MSLSIRQSSLLVSSPRVEGLITSRIFEARPVAQGQWSVWLKAEEGFPDFLPGNFCMLSLPDFVDPLTPRPFAIVEKRDGMYQFIYRVTGKFTHFLATLPIGSRVGVLGPLGKGFSRSHFASGKHIFISGGVGFASLLPALDALSKAKQNPAGNFYGVRTEMEVIRKAAFQFDFASDDGSIGFKGRLHELLKTKEALISKGDYFYICGPTPMMKAIYDLLPREKSFYFLEEAMGCGVGICIGCVVPIQGENKEVKRVRSCLEGPIFRGDVLEPWRN